MIELREISVRANEELKLQRASPDSRIQASIFKRFLKLENERLKISQRLGTSGKEITTARAFLCDLLVLHACDEALHKVGQSCTLAASDFAIVAIGGYGRRELAPYSDLDLLFLHSGKNNEALENFIQRILYPLWDAGLIVGHSVRTIRETVSMAKKDLHSRHAIVDARLLTGNSELFQQLNSSLQESIFQNLHKKILLLRALKDAVAARYARFGNEICLQEPNVKEGVGGLRDIHTILWSGYLKYGCKSLEELQTQGHLSNHEYSSIQSAYDFLLRVRNEAHHSGARKMDLLTFDLQPLIAANLGYKPKQRLLASEVFMREYYQRTHELHRICNRFLLKTIASNDETDHFPDRSKRISISTHSPLAMLQLFEFLQIHELPISEALREEISLHLPLIDRAFRSSPDAAAIFRRILGTRGKVGRILRLMHELRVLDRYLPEFARVTFVVQQDFYHKYTVEEHSLKAVEALDQLVLTSDTKSFRYSKVLEEITNPGLLFLGVFLHDLGKGKNGSHVQRGIRIGVRICKRLQLDSTSTEDVLFLIRQHLLMSHISQRRDLAEESVLQEFCRTVQTIERLNMLLLLTYADISAVGPGVWNEWKDALLWELYSRAKEILTAGQNDAGENRIGEWSGNFNEAAIEDHLSKLPARYRNANSMSEIATHFELIRQLETASVVTEWKNLPEQHCSQVTLCARDRRGLFATIAGSLTLHGINILSADVYTREDGIVIDILKVSSVYCYRPVRAELWLKFDRKLKSALEGSCDIRSEIEMSRHVFQRRIRASRFNPKRPRVRLCPDASATNTVVEIHAQDEPGLAYKVACALTSLGLNITFAKIATEKRHALDVFYVTDSFKGKISPAMFPEIERSVLEALKSDGIQWRNR